MNRCVVAADSSNTPISLHKIPGSSINAGTKVFLWRVLREVRMGIIQCILTIILQKSHHRLIAAPMILPQTMVADNVPPLCSSLTTRCHAYPTWILLSSDPVSVPLQRRDLGNEVYEALLALRCAIAVPGCINDIVEAMFWMQEQKNFYDLCQLLLHGLWNVSNPRELTQPVHGHWMFLPTMWARLLEQYFSEF